MDIRRLESHKCNISACPHALIQQETDGFLRGMQGTSAPRLWSHAPKSVHYELPRRRAREQVEESLRAKRAPLARPTNQFQLLAELLTLESSAVTGHSRPSGSQQSAVSTLHRLSDYRARVRSLVLARTHSQASADQPARPNLVAVDQHQSALGAGRNPSRDPIEALQGLLNLLPVSNERRDVSLGMRHFLPWPSRMNMHLAVPFEHEHQPYSSTAQHQLHRTIRLQRCRKGRIESQICNEVDGVGNRAWSRSSCLLTVPPGRVPAQYSKSCDHMISCARFSRGRTRTFLFCQNGFRHIRCLAININPTCSDWGRGRRSPGPSPSR